MSEQETVQNEASEQSLAESVTELEQLTQYALEVEGEERDQLIEQIKSKCEEEGLTSDEAEALIEEIGLVQEAKKSTKESRGADKAGGETSDMKNAATDVTPAYDAPGSGSSAKPAKGKSPKRKADANSAGEGGGKVSEDTEVEEATAEVKEEMPKTKSACMQKFYEKMGKLRKADIMANYDSIMKSLDLQEETEDSPDHSPIDVSDDIEALTSGEELSEDFKTKYWFSLDKKYPVSWDNLSNRIRLSNGTTRTDKETFTEDELKDAGYVFTDIYPNYNDEIHICSWNGTDWVLTQHYFPNEEPVGSDEATDVSD